MIHTFHVSNFFISLAFAREANPPSSTEFYFPHPTAEQVLVQSQKVPPLDCPTLLQREAPSSLLQFQSGDFIELQYGLSPAHQMQKRLLRGFFVKSTTNGLYLLRLKTPHQEASAFDAYPLFIPLKDVQALRKSRPPASVEAPVHLRTILAQKDELQYTPPHRTSYPFQFQVNASGLQTSISAGDRIQLTYFPEQGQKRRSISGIIREVLFSEPQVPWALRIETIQKENVVVPLSQVAREFSYIETLDPKHEAFLPPQAQDRAPYFKNELWWPQELKTRADQPNAQDSGKLLFWNHEGTPVSLKPGDWFEAVSHELNPIDVPFRHIYFVHEILFDQQGNPMGFIGREKNAGRTFKSPIFFSQINVADSRILPHPGQPTHSEHLGHNGLQESFMPAGNNTPKSENPGASSGDALWDAFYNAP